MNNLLRKLAGFEDVEKNDEIEEIKTQIKAQKEKSPKGKLKFQITNGFILFGLVIIWVFVMSMIRAMELRLGWIPWSISILLLFGSYELIIKKRKKAK